MIMTLAGRDVKRPRTPARHAQVPPGLAPPLRAVASGGLRASAVEVEVVGAGAERRGLVLGVEEGAAVDREAAAADTGRKPFAEGLERGDPAVDVGAPGTGEAFPVAARRCARGRQSLERFPDLV